jgi:AbrB family looped-hinge helix DNA binding protein
MHMPELHGDYPMREILATITGRGQVTVPAEVRRLLGTRRGDKVAFVVDDEGSVRLTVAPYPNVASVRGVAGSLEHPLAWKQMRDIAHEDRAEVAHRKST